MSLCRLDLRPWHGLKRSHRITGNTASKIVFIIAKIKRKSLCGPVASVNGEKREMSRQSRMSPFPQALRGASHSVVGGEAKTGSPIGTARTGTSWRTISRACVQNLFRFRARTWRFSIWKIVSPYAYWTVSMWYTMSVSLCATAVPGLRRTKPSFHAVKYSPKTLPLLGARLGGNIDPRYPFAV
jgi:hypothetical protein